MATRLKHDNFRNLFNNVSMRVQGETGDKGDRGEIGVVGAKGQKGDVGNAGEQVSLTIDIL